MVVEIRYDQCSPPYPPPLSLPTYLPLSLFILKLLNRFTSKYLGNLLTPNAKAFLIPSLHTPLPLSINTIYLYIYIYIYSHSLFISSLSVSSIYHFLLQSAPLWLFCAAWYTLILLLWYALLNMIHSYCSSPILSALIWFLYSVQPRFSPLSFTSIRSSNSPQLFLIFASCSVSVLLHCDFSNHSPLMLRSYGSALYLLVGSDWIGSSQLGSACYSMLCF